LTILFSSSFVFLHNELLKSQLVQFEQIQFSSSSKTHSPVIVLGLIFSTKKIAIATPVIIEAIKKNIPIIFLLDCDDIS
jgi:hypothetical protein